MLHHVDMLHFLCFRLFVDSYFLGLTAVNCAAVNMGVQVSLRILISIVWIETQKWGSGGEMGSESSTSAVGSGSRCEGAEEITEEVVLAGGTVSGHQNMRLRNSALERLLSSQSYGS